MRFLSKISQCGAKRGCFVAWRRPTLPRLKTQYHRRWRLSRPSSVWIRVFILRHYHQTTKQPLPKNTHPHKEIKEKSCHNHTRNRAKPTPSRQQYPKPQATSANQSPSSISTSSLHTSPRVHSWPINVVVYHDSNSEALSRGKLPA